MSDEDQARLERRFALADALGFNPEWLVGGEGFEYDCPECNERHETRAGPRIHLTIGVFQGRVILMPGLHTAHGAAVA